MAFVDLGDQFIALAQSSETRPGQHVHHGLVVDDQAAAVERARAAGHAVHGHDVVDPWGNTWQIVDYRDVQFSKSGRILEGMGLAELEKSPGALDELRRKGLAD
jgi:hypothetical protein